MEYLDHDGENAIETLRKLLYDFLSAENAIIEAKQCNNIVEWTRKVIVKSSVQNLCRSQERRSNGFTRLPERK